MTLQELLRRASDFDQSAAEDEATRQDDALGSFAEDYLDTHSFVLGARWSNNQYAPLFKEMENVVEALEFMTMPITAIEPTVEGLLITMNEDDEKGKAALKSLRERLGGMNG